MTSEVGRKVIARIIREARHGFWRGDDGMKVEGLSWDDVIRILKEETDIQPVLGGEK